MHDLEQHHLVPIIAHPLERGFQRFQLGEEIA